MNQELEGLGKPREVRLPPVNPATDRNNPEQSKIVDLGRSFPQRQALTPPHEEALKLLPEISEAEFEKTLSFPESDEFGDPKAYAANAQGQNVSQRAFVGHYLNALERVIGVARDFLKAGWSLEAYRTMRNASIKETIRQLPSQPPRRSEWSELQASYESSIRREIIRLGQASPEDKELRYRGLCYAILALNAAENDLQTQRLVKTNGVRLAEYVDIMHEARRRAGTAPHVLQVLKHFVSIVRDRYEYFPGLHVINGFDGNLTTVPESGSKYKPGEPTNKLIDKVDALLNLALHARLPLTECAGLDADRILLAHKLNRVAAVESELYPDAGELFHRLKVPGVSHTVLSGNNANLVRAKLELDGLSSCRVIGLDEVSWHPNKLTVLVNKLLKDPTFGVWLFCDDNDGSVAANIKRQSNGHCAGINLSDIFFMAGRVHSKQSCRIAESLKTLDIPFVDNSSVASHGMAGTLGFVKSWRHLERCGESPRTQVVISSAHLYQEGEVSAQCRDAYELSPEIPKPEIRTIIKPVQSLEVNQYDLGVPTALLLPDGRWVVLYKAASGPSGAGNILKPMPSNVFAAVMDPRSFQVEYFDADKKSPTPRGIKPLLTSGLDPALCRDGLHDPRATWLNGRDQALILACAFNKVEEQRSLQEARGDPFVPLQGAYTQLFTTKNPLDAKSYINHGLFGPDFHFKNLAVFPETRTVRGQECLLLLTRKYPGIQCIPVPINDLEHFKDEVFRREFWRKNLTKSALEGFKIMDPALPHEGYPNPYSQGALGQIAPGLPPVKVCLKPGPEMPAKNYWLMVYNSVPDYVKDAPGKAHGRLICGALLDYENPWELVARAPLPIITSRSYRDIQVAEQLQTPRHEDVVFAGGGGEGLSLNEGEPAPFYVFFTEADSIVRVAAYKSAAELGSYIAQFDSDGSPLWSTSGFSGAGDLV